MVARVSGQTGGSNSAGVQWTRARKGLVAVVGIGVLATIALVIAMLIS